MEEARQNLFNTKWDLLELMDKRDNTVCHLTACLKAVSSEWSAPDQGSADVITTRRSRLSGGGSLEQVVEEEDAETDLTGYPKTKVIISGSTF